MPQPERLTTAAPLPFADTLDARVRRVTRPVAFAGVLGMLAVAAVAVILRWSGLGGITAMNEIVEMLFAVALAATLPAAAAQRVHLRIDLLDSAMGPSLRPWLDAMGARMLLVFLALLGREAQAYADRMLSGGRRRRSSAGRWGCS